MTDDPQRWPGPPDAELEALLALAAEPPPAPSDARSRVFDRVAATVALPLAGGPESLAGTSSTASSGAATGAGTATTGATSASATTGATAAAGVSVSTAVASGGVLGAQGIWIAVLGAVAASAVAASVWLNSETGPPARPASTTDSRSAEPTPEPAAPTQPSARAPSAPVRAGSAAHPQAPAEAAATPAPIAPPTAGSMRPEAETARASAVKPLQRRSETRAITRERPAHPGRPAATADERPTDPTAPAPETGTADDPRPEAVVEPADAPRPAPPIDAALSAERSLLAEAIRAMDTGDSTGAGRALDLHQARFATGLLAEERMVLRIRWLVMTGDAAAARAAANAFRQRAPESLLQRAVDALVDTLPR